MIRIYKKEHPRKSKKNKKKKLNRERADKKPIKSDLKYL